jgi:hypothetical protein
LARDDLPVDVALLDQDRPRTHVPDLDCEQLLGRAQPLVSDQETIVAAYSFSRSSRYERIASTCAGARHTIARSRRPLGFSTCCTGFGPGTHRHRIACLNMLCSITIDTRTACRPTPAASRSARKSATTSGVISRSL